MAGQDQALLLLLGWLQLLELGAYSYPVRITQVPVRNKGVIYAQDADLKAGTAS